MPKLELADITPEHKRCPASMCPAVYDAGDDLIIIGKQLDKDMLMEISGKVGPDEYAIRISKAYLPGGGGG